jgi:hypothetical protein
MCDDGCDDCGLAWIIAALGWVTVIVVLVVVLLVGGDG